MEWISELVQQNYSSAIVTISLIVLNNRFFVYPFYAKTISKGEAIKLIHDTTEKEKLHINRTLDSIEVSIRKIEIQITKLGGEIKI